MKLKKIIRRLLRIDNNLSFSDYISKKKSKIKRIFFRKKYSKAELKNAFEKLGIRKGDSLMVHCSYSEMFNFLGTPSDVIDILINLIGIEGTLIMPCYSVSPLYFDIKNSKSNAGLLSETFRNYPGVKRSLCSNFSVCGIGKRIDYYIGEHFKSDYGLDEYSPYYKFVNEANTKVIMIGLNKKPAKHTVFHCSSYSIRNQLEFLSNLYENKYISEIVDENGNHFLKEMRTRNNNIRNCKFNMKKIFNKIPNEYKSFVKLSNLNLVAYDSLCAFNIGREEGLKGRTIYSYLKRK